MSATLNAQGNECCSPCPSPVVSQVPGPQGPSGAMGTNGTNGQSAFTTVSAPNFTVPAVGSFTIFNVGNTSWIFLNEILYIPGAGYFQVTGIPGLTQLKLTNPPAYSVYNFPAGTVVPAGTGISPSGVIGPQGASGISTLNGVSPTTTKGDIIVDNGANNPLANDVRLAVGSDGKILTALSSQPTGVGWNALDLAGVLTALINQLPISKGGTGQATAGPAFDALSPMTTNGDLITRAGGVNARLGIGTAGQFLTVSAGLPAWGTLTNNVLQLVQQTSNTYQSISTSFSFTDTLPTTAGGTQILSLNVTPSNNTSRLVVTALVQMQLNSGAVGIIGLFSGGSNAIYSAYNSGSGSAPLSMLHEFTPGSTTPLTLSLRAGTNGAGSIEINGASGGRLLGGSLRTWMTIAEYA